ncbi:MAG: hypothetical protein KJ893_09535 [Candidatus Omnitrophica bacterium]|nr:hypothetical protein [Candidatus Omnitrophota bacterium]MBU4478475.1 hypothetical protein [Candidatus Omnitrophota bacterium]MCG2703776.1 hypothetical protein [Candidatus Omnitrophota bacterium]
MVKVKTFTKYDFSSYQPTYELEKLDEQVNAFFQKENISRVISLCDTATNNENGQIMGIIRVVTYETPVNK